MDRFAELLNRLSTCAERNGKLKLLSSYFREVPDPDRGLALAVLTDNLPVSFPMRRVLADPMPPQPTLAIRSLSLFQGWFLRRFKTELKANGAASDAATNDRREICMEHIEQENSLRRKRM